MVLPIRQWHTRAHTSRLATTNWARQEQGMVKRRKPRRLKGERPARSLVLPNLSAFDASGTRSVLVTAVGVCALRCVCHARLSPQKSHVGILGPLGAGGHQAHRPLRQRRLRVGLLSCASRQSCRHGGERGEEGGIAVFSRVTRNACA